LEERTKIEGPNVNPFYIVVLLVSVTAIDIAPKQRQRCGNKKHMEG